MANLTLIQVFSILRVLSGLLFVHHELPTPSTVLQTAHDPKDRYSDPSTVLRTAHDPNDRYSDPSTVLRTAHDPKNRYADPSAVLRTAHDPKDRYAVVIDAGSSGTRVYAYKFRIHTSEHRGAKSLAVIDEFSLKIKPGLSSYADDPDNGANTVVDLIRRVDPFVPSADKARTPLLVRATAGLRLLPGQQAKRLIRSVRRAISRLGYHTNERSVDIMSGHDEGIYGWYSVNILYKSLHSSESKGILDMGGASFEVTHQVERRDSARYPHADLFTVDGRKDKIYSHSYLSLGRNEARRGIFRLEADSTVVSSVCMPQGVNHTWDYKNSHLIISGAPDLTVKERISQCSELVRKYLQKTMAWSPKEPPPGLGRMVAYDTLYNYGFKTGLVDENGGEVSVGQYMQAATRACAGDVYRDLPWACVDLIYFYTVLHDGLHMPDDYAITLVDLIDGYTVGWTLGLAYKTVVKSLPEDFNVSLKSTEEVCVLSRRTDSKIKSPVSRNCF